eukprot:gene24695-10328_t
MPEEEEPRFIVYDDMCPEGQGPTCPRCGEDISELQWCASCVESTGSASVSAFAAQEAGTLLDGGVTIWVGMPDDPEPYCSLKQRPIYKYHPEIDTWTQRIPLSKLDEQMYMESKDGAHCSFECFICGQTHGENKEKEAK